MKRQIIIVVLLILTVLFITSCFPGANPAQKVANEFGVNAGFLRGLWHGFIAPFTFIVSLFTENINLYEVHNNGGWYDFGFVIGAGIIFSGSGRASGHKRKRA
jgi:hypothetical protein